MNSKTKSGMSGAEEQATFWLMEMEEAPLSSKEEAKFKAWLMEDKIHLQAFNDLRKLNNKMASLRQDVLQDTGYQNEALDISVLEAIDQVASHRAQKKKINEKSKLLYRYIASIAAVFFIALGTFWFYPESVITYKTAVGEQETVMLQDGSILTLNTGSEVAVAMTPGIRRLHLVKGEVYFEVAKDKKRPFEVAVQNAYVKAIGTAFNIKQQGKEVSVLVTEGIVELKHTLPSMLNSAPPPQLTPLKAGEQVFFGVSPLKRITLPSSELNKQISWREGQIIFDEVSLAEIVQAIQPYIPSKIIIMDEEVGQLVAGGGVFQIGKVRSFFGALEAILPVKIIREKDVIILTARTDKIPTST